MSVVPQHGILRKHYEEAIEDVEYKSSAFWQAWLQRAFFETDLYSVTSESSPDGSRRRVDHLVLRYDPEHHTFSAMLWVECKRSSGSVREVEEQALDAALRCITRDGLLWIYAMTTVGASFRTWFVEKGLDQLQPLHGTSAKADKKQYINADSDDAWVLERTIHLVKTQIPLKEAPVIPSQPLPTSYIGGEHGEGSSQGLAYQGEYAQRSTQGETSQGEFQPPPSSAPLEEGGDAEGSAGLEEYQAEDYQPEESTVMETEQTGTQGSGGYMEVRVERIKHTFKPDEYAFKDAKGHKKAVGKDHWERATYNGERVWVFRGKRTTYFTRQKLG